MLLDRSLRMLCPILHPLAQVTARSIDPSLSAVAAATRAAPSWPPGSGHSCPASTYPDPVTMSWRI